VSIGSDSDGDHEGEIDGELGLDLGRYADDPATRLMARFQQGDDLAFTQLVEQHQQRVMNIAARYVGRTTDTEDLAQEVFLRVYRHRERWQPRAKFTTWLFQITVNLSLNWIRDTKRKRMASIDAPLGRDGEGSRPEPEDASSPTAHESLELRERAAIVQAAINELPENQRMAVLLFRQEGLPYQEVAEAMGVSLPAVKSLLNRAKTNLRTTLEPMLEAMDGTAEASEADESGAR
jgi:RNA polymerase sigma-70 factor (ECF subfamily)